MRAADRILQRWRIRKVAPYIHTADRLLDAGCHRGELIEYVRPRLASAVGIDPVAEPRQGDGVTILRGTLPGDARLESASFDCVVMLAVLEHMPDPAAVLADCYRLLRPGGRLALTVPHPFVDQIVDFLVRIGVADGMDFDSHHGFDVSRVEPLASRIGFRLVVKRSFQLGLNRLFVFRKPPGRPAAE